MTSFKAISQTDGPIVNPGNKGHTVETIRDSVVALRKRFPKAGARDMTSLLFHEMGMKVSR